MRCEWSAQRARRVRICAVLAMHVPNLGIHTLWRLPCTPIHPCSLFTGKKRKCLLVFLLRSAKVGLLKTFRLVLRCAVRRSLSAFCRKQDKGSMHDTQCINCLGWFLIRRGLV